MKTEFLHVLPPTIFFLISFNIVAITTLLMLKDRGIELPPFVVATLLALVVGKVILVADHLPFINRFPDKPLIYNILWKTLIYWLVVFVVRYIEHYIPYLKTHGDLWQAHLYLVGDVEWRRFFAIQIWLLVLFIFYSVLFEFVRILGQARVRKMFFG